MNYAFEAAAISITLGAIASVLLQGRLLDRQDSRNVPPRVAFILQAIDVWLAAVFILVVVIVIAAIFDATAHRQSLSLKDRQIVEHLIGVAAIYPVMIAITRRTLPILFSPSGGETPDAAPRLEPLVLLMPLLGLIAASFLLPELLDPSVALSTELLRITLVGLVVVGPCIAAPSLITWRSRRLMRRVATCARQHRLTEQTVIGSLPDDAGEVAARVFVGRIDGQDTCWLDIREVDRLVRCLASTRSGVRRQGLNPASPERWYWSGGFKPRLTVRYDGKFGRFDRGWSCPNDEPFVDASELLCTLGARVPLNRE